MTKSFTFATTSKHGAALGGRIGQGSRLVARKFNAGIFSMVLAFALVLGFSSNPLRAQSPFDGFNLGDLDFGNLVVVHDDPVALDALDVLSVVLPLDLTGTEPVLVLLIDPDGDEGTDNSFVLPIQLSDLLSADPENLLATIGIGDDVLSELDLDLIPGLEDLLDDLLGGLLGGILGGGGSGVFSLADIVGELNDALIGAIGIDLTGEVGYILRSSLSLVGIEEVLVAEVAPAIVQPDVTVGNKANKQRGNNVYSGGRGQAVQLPKSGRRNSRAFFTIGNDGNTFDTIRGHSRTFGIKAKSKRVRSQGSNVSARFRAGTYRVGLNPGGLVRVIVTDQPTRKARKSKSLPANTFAISARSTSDGTKFDRAEAVVPRAGKRK